jgi:hypothetical protein
MPRKGSHRKLTRKNTCSQSSGSHQDHWLRIGYQQMHRLRAHTSAMSLSHAEQVPRFRIRQDSVNDEFVFTWIMSDLTIGGSHSNVSLTRSSKECLICHIPQISHQATFIVSALWSNACKLTKVGHSQSSKRMNTRCWALSGRMN